MTCTITISRATYWASEAARWDRNADVLREAADGLRDMGDNKGADNLKNLACEWRQRALHAFDNACECEGKGI